MRAAIGILSQGEARLTWSRRTPARPPDCCGPAYSNPSASCGAVLKSSSCQDGCCSSRVALSASSARTQSIPPAASYSAHTRPWRDPVVGKHELKTYIRNDEGEPPTPALAVRAIRMIGDLVYYTDRDHASSVVVRQQSASCASHRSIPATPTNLVSRVGSHWQPTPNTSVSSNAFPHIPRTSPVDLQQAADRFGGRPDSSPGSWPTAVDSRPPDAEVTGGPQLLPSPHASRRQSRPGV